MFALFNMNSHVGRKQYLTLTFKVYVFSVNGADVITTEMTSAHINWISHHLVLHFSKT